MSHPFDLAHIGKQYRSCFVSSTEGLRLLWGSIKDYNQVARVNVGAVGLHLVWWLGNFICASNGGLQQTLGFNLERGCECRYSSSLN